MGVAAELAEKRRDDEPLRIAIVGHEPHLSGLVIWLLSGQASNGADSPKWMEIKKGGVCLLSFEEEPTLRLGQLRWCVTRSRLEQLGRD